MAIALRTGTTADSANSGGSNVGPINVPTSTQNGDLLILMICNNSAGTITGPASGWTKIGQATSSNYALGVFWRRAASEPASYTYTTPSGTGGAMMMTYYDTGGGTASFGTFVTAIQNSSTTVTMPAFTPNDTTNDQYELVLSIFSGPSLNAPTVPALGYFADNGAGGGSGNGYCQLIPVKKNTATPTPTITDTAARNWAVMRLSLYNSGTKTTQPLGIRAARWEDNGGAGITSLPVPVPTNIIAGDMMIAMVTPETANATITAPSGWTRLFGDHNDASFQYTLSIYWKVASGSEPASYNWSVASGSPTFSCSLLAVYHDTGGGILQNAFANVDNASATNSVTPTVTTTTANALIVAMWRATNNYFATGLPTTDSLVFRNNNGVPTLRAMQFQKCNATVFTQVAAGTTSTRTAILSNPTTTEAFQIALGAVAAATTAKQPTIVVPIR